MRNWIFTILFLFFGHAAMATHIVGGEIYYNCIGNNLYKITLKVYRDCGPGNNLGTGFDPYASVGIYDSGGNLQQTLSMPFPGAKQLPVIIDNPCFIVPPNICVEEAEYTDVVTLPPKPGGYDIIYQRCCRNPTIVNIINPGSVGATFSAHIPDTAVSCNNAANFKQFPPLVICQDDSISFDHSAVDTDGDSLVYSLCTPTHGGSQSNPAPNPPTSPPFSNVPWKTGYSGTYPIDASPSFKIDSQTGMLTGKATKTGQYVVGVCVSEYRNGKLLNLNQRDFQFNVTQCQVQSVAAIAEQQIYCDGRTVSFTNNSQNASEFYWSFGDPNSSSDTSTIISPVYTYQDTGLYTVMLIANPGRFCADTSYKTFRVDPPLYPEFDVPSPQCFQGNSFNFEADGKYGPNPEISWDFGSSAKPDSSNLEKPQGIKFSSEGFFPVTLTISEFGCERSYTDIVKVYPHPEAGIGLEEEEGCKPFEVKFKNTSTAWTNLKYQWEFSNGEFSTDKNPVVIFEDTGKYDVKLTVRTTSGCIDTSEVFRENLITVNPTPVAEFTATPLETSMYEPEISFFDHSDGNIDCIWFFNDSLFLNSCPSSFSHSFQDTGNVWVSLVVSNEFSCKDTTLKMIRINPEYTFFIPNSFTPDGDGLNEVYKPKVYAAREYEFFIFDRWGHLMFKTSDPEKGWDGRISGGDEIAPTGTYVYMVETIDQKNRPHNYTGTFHLLK